MSRFIDVYLDAKIPSYPLFASPRWSTDIVVVDSGAEQVNQRWAHPLHRYTLPEAVRQWDQFQALRDHWLVMRGPAHTWPFRDPLDFASRPLDYPSGQLTVSPLDQTIGTANGITTRFQLTKLYQRGTQQYTRRIALPVVSSVRVALDGVEVLTGWTVSRPGGEVIFDVAPSPEPGNPGFLKAGFLFDVEVRFEDDAAFDGVVRAFGVGGFADVTLVETRSC